MAFFELGPGQCVLFPFLEHSHLVDLAKVEDPLFDHNLSGRNASALTGQPGIEHDFQGQLPFCLCSLVD